MDALFIVTLLLLVNIVDSTCPSPTNLCSCSVVEGLKVINCRYKTLSAVPQFTANTEIYDKIDFSSAEETGICLGSSSCNSITIIPNDAFANLKVKLIDLRNNAIGTFEEHAFRGLNPTLETLFVEGNGTNEPPYLALTSLPNIKSLHLENFNQVNMTTSSALFQFYDMKSLTLKKFKGLKKINGDVFFFMKNMTEFTLEGLYQLQTLPYSAILELTKLTHLKISETGITQIYSSSLRQLDNLQEVYIERNDQLVTIHANAFQDIQDTIQFLVLESNMLSNLDCLGGTWNQLTQLNLGNNPLRSIQASPFSGMPKLAYLNLHSVELTSIDSSIFTGLARLHTLNLAYNDITNFPTGVFRNSPALNNLQLNEMNRQPIIFQENALQGIEGSLEVLWLEKNMLDLPTFWGNVAKLTNLIHLNVANISVSVIPDYAFRNNQKLTKIDLTDNKITELKQETFYGPKTTLQTLILIGNKIETVDKCVLHDFVNKPTLSLLDNHLHCDCRILWLYDWINNQNDPSINFKTGSCASPPNLKDMNLNLVARESLMVCPNNYTEPVCPDLYASTTKPPKTTTITTPRPLPTFNLKIFQEAETFIKLTWTIQDKTELTGYKLEMTSNNKPKVVRPLHKDLTESTFDNLNPGNQYYFCLILEIKDVFQEDHPSCLGGKTLPPLTTTTVMVTTEAAPQTNVPVIVGTTVGAVLLIAIIIAILYILLKSNKAKKRAPMTGGVSFMPHADIPQAGGTAKRFAKKTEKEGASPDDISVTVISGADMNNRERMSAGSYQFLNEKDPKKVNDYPNPDYKNNGHYANSLDDRPLPSAPYSGGANGTGKGYVNTGSQSVDLHAPETSTNQYSEVRY